MGVTSDQKTGLVQPQAPSQGGVLFGPNVSGPGATVPAMANSAGPDRDVQVRELSDALQDKGFLLTTTEDIINWARNGSLHWMTFGLACCAIEMMQVSMPRYDLERFGTAPRASPRPTGVRSIARRALRAQRSTQRTQAGETDQPGTAACTKSISSSSWKDLSKKRSTPSCSQRARTGA